MKKPFVQEGLLRSFGRIASRMTVAEQKKLDAALAPFVLNTPDEVHKFAAANHVVVELGVGRGEQILVRAESTPSTSFIACEVFKNGLRFLARHLQEKEVQNLKLFAQDARLLLQQLPEKSVDQLLVLYPDPWPKARHKRRRLVNAPLLEEAARVLKPEGELILVTDIVDYALWMLHQVYQNGQFFPLATSPAQWALPPQWWVQTGYERKALKEGRSAFYFILKHRDQIPVQAHNKGETTQTF